MLLNDNHLNIDRYVGGAREDRTPDLLRARQALSQLSYGPNVTWVLLGSGVPFRSDD